MATHRQSTSRSELPAWAAPWNIWVDLQAPFTPAAAPLPTEAPAATARDARRALRVIRGLARSLWTTGPVRTPRTARPA